MESFKHKSRENSIMNLYINTLNSTARGKTAGKRSDKI